MHKKVWIYILIIVVISSLFPSILIARAEDGDGGGGAGGIPVEGGEDEYPPDEIPDIEWSVQNAPYPGNMGFLTEYKWQLFIERADELGHTSIKRIEAMDIIYEDGHTETRENMNIFYSTDGTESNIEEIYDIKVSSNNKYYNFKYLQLFKDEDKVNQIDEAGQFRNDLKALATHSAVSVPNNRPDLKPIECRPIISTWYNAEVIDDPFQDKPERYNIDPSRGWGMSFLKPAFGEWVNVPHKLRSYKDYIEIEIQMPHLYESNGWTYTMFNVTDGIGKVAVPNFGIRLYSHNVKRIEGSQVIGRNGIWILPYQIKFIEGYMDGTYMHGARFIASVPIEHAKPLDGGHSLIVADLVIHKEPFEEDFSIEIPEARTWTKYLTYMGVVDADGDGYDDRTGHPIGQTRPEDTIKDGKPNKDDYDDGILGTISYYFDTFIWYIKQPFVFIADLIGNIINWISTTIDGWIDGFTSIFTTLFSFLPAEVILMLALGFATMMIITIIRAIRGS